MIMCYWGEETFKFHHVVVIEKGIVGDRATEKEISTTLMINSAVVEVSSFRGKLIRLNSFMNFSLWIVGLQMLAGIVIKLDALWRRLPMYEIWSGLQRRSTLGHIQTFLRRRRRD